MREEKDCNIHCDVSHGGLVVELANPGHWAIFEQAADTCLRRY